MLVSISIKLAAPLDVFKQLNEAENNKKATTCMTRTDIAILELNAFPYIGVILAARDADAYFLIDIHLCT